MKKIIARRTFSMGEYRFIKGNVYEVPTLIANGVLNMKLCEEVKEEEPKKKKSKKDKVEE